MGSYVRQTKSDAELKALRSALGRKGGEARKALGYATVGRPKGSRNRKPGVALPSKTLSVRGPDYKVYSKLAKVQGVSLAEFMHLLAEHMKLKNPRLFFEV